MEEKIINLNYKSIDDQIKGWQKSKAQSAQIIEMTRTSGWKLLENTLRQEINKVALASIEGFKDYETYQIRTAEARAMKKMLDAVATSIKVNQSADNVIKKLKESKE